MTAARARIRQLAIDTGAVVPTEMDRDWPIGYQDFADLLGEDGDKP